MINWIYLKNSSTEKEWTEMFPGMLASASHVEFCVPTSVNIMDMHRRHVTYKEYYKNGWLAESFANVVCPVCHTVRRSHHV